MFFLYSWCSNFPSAFRAFLLGMNSLHFFIWECVGILSWIWNSEFRSFLLAFKNTFTSGLHGFSWDISIPLRQPPVHLHNLGQVFFSGLLFSGLISYFSYADLMCACPFPTHPIRRKLITPSFLCMTSLHTSLHVVVIQSHAGLTHLVFVLSTSWGDGGGGEREWEGGREWKGRSRRKLRGSSWGLISFQEPQMTSEFRECFWNCTN